MILLALSLIVVGPVASGEEPTDDEEPQSTSDSSDEPPCYAVDMTKTPPEIYQVPCP